MPKRANKGAKHEAQNALPATPAKRAPTPPLTLLPIPETVFLVIRIEYTCIVMNKPFNKERAVSRTKS